MTFKDDFCVFILTHGRPDNVVTYDTMKKCGYTGKVYIVIDDEDKTADEYYKKFGDKVLMFSKKEIAKKFDEGDNFEDRRCIIYARNACFELAERVGCKHFIQFDDDYTEFSFRYPKPDGKNLAYRSIKSLDRTLEYMFNYFRESNMLTLAMAQGGDYIGGYNSQAKKGFKRKAMNSFICSLDRPFMFYGRINEDVNFYSCEGRRGALIATLYGVMLNQKQTQSNAGGMTDIYLDKGTYVKSFYTVIYSPSCVELAEMGSKNRRIHHRVKWEHTVPKILNEKYRKKR